MTDLDLSPNMEALVSAFLRDQPEVADLLPVDDNGSPMVVTAISSKSRYPLVRVTQLLDTPNGSPLWGIAFEIQIEAFAGAGGKAEAFRIANTCRAAIDKRIVGVHDGYGVVNGSTPGSLLDLPDETFQPSKPRWLFTSTIYGHPVATLSS